MNIRYTIVKNEMAASAEDAKYLGKAIANGVRNRAQMTALALETEHVSEATFDAVLEAMLAVTLELCAEGRDVDWGPVKFLAKMHGSLPCEDSAFDDGTTTLTVDAEATNATRTALETLEPVKVSATELAASVKVSNVMDVETELFGTVVGSHEFAILGNGITLDGEGEYAKALNKKTGATVGTAQVLRVSKGQRAYAKFRPQLAAGDYTLEVATKGLDGETTPRIFHKPITALAAEVEPIAETPDQKCQVTAFRDGDNESEFKLENEWKAEGKGFYATSVEGEWMIEDVAVEINGTRVSFTYTPSTDHTKLALVKNSGEVAAGTYENQVCKIALSKGATTHEFEIPLAKVIVAA